MQPDAFKIGFELSSLPSGAKEEARRSRPRRARRDTGRGAFGSEASGAIGLNAHIESGRIERKGTLDLGAKDFTEKAPYGSVTAQRDEDAKPRTRRSSACSCAALISPPKNIFVFFSRGKNGFGLSVGIKTENLQEEV